MPDDPDAGRLTAAPPLTAPDPARGPGDPGAARGLTDEAAEQLADVMFALAAPSRLQILACLAPGARSVTEIVDTVGMEQSSVSHQLRVLREHGIVTVERRGRHRLYALRTAHVGAVLECAHAHLQQVSARPAPPWRWRSG